MPTTADNSVFDGQVLKHLVALMFYTFLGRREEDKTGRRTFLNDYGCVGCLINYEVGNLASRERTPSRLCGDLSPMWGLNPRTVRSWPELKSRFGHLTNRATQVAPNPRLMFQTDNPSWSGCRHKLACSMFRENLPLPLFTLSCGHLSYYLPSNSGLLKSFVWMCSV